MIDNCQHFAQLLAEVISGRENRDKAREFFDKTSFMNLPVAASWLLAPVYGCTMALHHGLTGDAQEQVGKFLENIEDFYLHPRVYAKRREQNPFTRRK